MSYDTVVMAAHFATARDSRAILERAGTLADDAIDLAETALALGAMDRRAVGLSWYRDHLNRLVEAIGTVGQDDGAEEAAERLRRVMAGQYGYQGDTRTYEDLQNANLTRVIDRRKGLPVALGILYLHVGRAAGWALDGLNFPGHFLIRLETNGERAIIDPFNGGERCGPVELRLLLKTIVGIDAELEPAHYETVGNRDILLRLQNNIKTRYMRQGRPDHAVDVLERMLLLAPNDPMLWREAGLIRAALGDNEEAIEALERVLALGATDNVLHETAVLVQQLKNRLI